MMIAIAIAIAIAIVWLDIGHIPVVRKYFADLYKASLKDKSKHVKAHATKNALKEANAEVNNALVMYNSNAPINIKGLKVSNFFEDLDGKIGHLIGCGGVIGLNN